MSEVTDLTVIEIKPEQAPVLYVAGGLDAYLEQIRQAVNEVPDLSTKKGRDRVASLAAQVSRSKTAIEKPGREYLRRLKEAVRPAEAEIKRFVDACDELRDATRRPLTEWEAEQERIKAEEAMNAMHAEALVMNEEFDRQRAAQIEADHEMALLMNDAFDRDREEQRRLAEQARREHEERIKREAADQARRDAEAKHKAEIEAAARRAELAERQRVEAEQRAKREKEEAVAAERRRQEEEKAARLAEEQRKAEEETRRAADKEHRRTVNRRVIADLIAQGIPEEFAQKALLAIAGGKVQDAHIKY
ncbi:Phage protein [Enterobacter intestinihominis]